MAIEDYYNQTAQRFTRGKSTLANPDAPSVNVGDPFSCWINNRSGNLNLVADKQTSEYNATLKCPVSQTINASEYIRHVETGREYKIVRINNDAGGYRGHHQTVYLEVNK